MAPPPPPPPPSEKQPVVGNNEDSFELRKNVTVPPKPVVPQAHPAPAKAPPPSPPVRPAFMPRALKLGAKVLAPKASTALPSPGLSKLPPISPGISDLKSELGAANEPAPSSQPLVTSSQTFPGIGGDLLSPKVARVQPQPHKSYRPVARVPPSPQLTFRDIQPPSREQAFGSGNKPQLNLASPSAGSGERTPHINATSHWRVSDSKLSAEPNRECSIPENDFSPGWIVTPVTKMHASSVTADQSEGAATTGMGAKIVFKKSRKWEHQKQHKQMLQGDSDLESDDEGPFVKPKKVVATPTKEPVSSGKLSKSRHSSVAERKYSSHRHHDSAHKHHYQSRRRSSSTTSTTSSSSSSDAECHYKKRKRCYYRSSSSSSYSSECEAYRSSKRARNDHRRRHHRKSEDGRHHKRRHHSHHHLSPHRGHDDSNDSSSSSSVLAQKRSRHPDHRSRHRSESHRYRSDSDRSRSPRRRRDGHHSHHQRKTSPARKEHHHHHHHEQLSLSAHKKTGAAGSIGESESRDKHHRDPTERDNSRIQSRRGETHGQNLEKGNRSIDKSVNGLCSLVLAEIKWDDGGMARSDSKSARGQGHILSTILAKGSHASLGDSGKSFKWCR